MITRDVEYYFNHNKEIYGSKINMDVLLVKWSHVKFLFEDLICDMVDGFEVKTVSHHEAWFTENKSYIKEFLHVLKFFLSILFSIFGKNIVFFGTNLCRIFFPVALFKKDIVFIYNEMPSFNGLVGLLDKVIFKRFYSQIYVSSELRKKICEEKYRVRISGVIHNIPSFISLNSSVSCKLATKKIKHEVIYAGVLSSTRLDDHIWYKIKYSKYQYKFMGFKTPDFNFPNYENVNYLGEYSVEESNEIQSQFRFAMLSYSTNDINNNYCAPIKIFEYINNECVCVVVNKNKGLENYVKKYPNLFVFIEDIDNYHFEEVEFRKEKHSFLSLHLNELTMTVKKML